MEKRRGRKPPAPLAPEEARGRALKVLGRREHSARELTSKLTHDGLDRATATEVVDELGESGWQSDVRYASLLTRSRISQSYGPLRIRAELSARGVDEALIRAALDEADPDWTSIIRKVYSRRYSSPFSSPKEKASRYRFLASRGFTSDQIKVVMKGDPVDEFEDDSAGDVFDDSVED